MEDTASPENARGIADVKRRYSFMKWGLSPKLSGLRKSHSFILLVLFMSMVGCRRDAPTVTQSSAKVEQEIFNFTTRHVKDNVVQWTLDAESAIFLQPEQGQDNQSEYDRIQVTKPNVLIHENGKPVIKIHSDRGQIYEDRYDLEFQGNVVAVHGDVTVYTEEMHWLNSQGQILAPDRVKMVRGDSVMYGKTLTADPKLKKAHMLDLEFTLYPKDEHTYVPIQ